MFLETLHWEYGFMHTALSGKCVDVIENALRKIKEPKITTDKYGFEITNTILQYLLRCISVSFIRTDELKL